MIELTDCSVIVGRRGCGKTHLSKGIQKIWPRRIIIDTMKEYRPDGEGQFLINSFSQFSQKLIELKKENPREFVIIYQFPVESGISETEFNEIMRLCYYFGNILIVIEEIQLHSKPQWIPHWLMVNLTTGRHKKLALLFTSQRPGLINKTIFSQCRHIFCGNLHDKNDVNYVANFLNQNSEKLNQLPIRRFIYFHDGNSQEISNDFSA